MAEHDPSIPSPDGSCPLLNLPGELLNRIYKYVLTEPDVDFVLSDESHPEFLTRIFNFLWDDQDIEVNQLKYVNRQMYNQTRGLTLCYNNIVILGTQRVLVILACTEFLDSCVPYHDHIGSVTLKYIWSYGRRIENLRDWRSVISFCTRYPQVQFKWTRLLSFRDFDFMFCTMEEFCSLRTGNVDPLEFPVVKTFLDSIPESPEKEWVADNFAHLRTTTAVFPANLKFVPFEDHFDETEYHRSRKIHEHDRDIGRGSYEEGLRYKEGGLDVWVALARDWYENGF
ncbi:hypothetical protein P154DRAFT_575093 [Amniculicola lignicola CBS 123094]|uniref:F-box domain-containing protein n=1 Tax=Amniculicola lignicola CBS 123094 TaxID=1392246 RepID=A0A6A5WHJ8_9PLEO|nr:hypothetical protein P154DRAFT_575093 [Amniculicola lignicola CBS 123094]